MVAAGALLVGVASVQFGDRYLLVSSLLGGVAFGYVLRLVVAPSTEDEDPESPDE